MKQLEELRAELKKVGEVKSQLYRMCTWSTTPQGDSYWNTVVCELNYLIYNIDERISQEEKRLNGRKEELCKEFEKKFLSLLETTKELGELEANEVKK